MSHLSLQIKNQIKEAAPCSELNAPEFNVPHSIFYTFFRCRRGIFLWLQLDGIEEPRSYVLPWSRELAQQLQDALQEAEERESGVRMRLPFEQSLDDREPRFYALPQPALPPKDQLDGPQIYEQPSTET